MIRTFDFIIEAWNDEEKMRQLMECIKGNADSELSTELCKIIFHEDIRRVDILPVTENNPFSSKIIPIRMTYNALLKMLSKDFEHFVDDDIIII